MKRLIDFMKQHKVQAVYMLLNIAIYGYFLISRSFFDGQLLLSKKRILLFTGLFAGTSFVLLFEPLRNLSRKHYRLFSLPAFLIIPWLVFFNGQMLISGKILEQEHALHILLLNMAMVYLILGLFMVLSNRIKLSLRLLIILWTVFLLANYYVDIFRGNMIIAADFYSIGTAASVAGNYDYTISYEVLRCVYIAFALWTVLNMIPSHKLIGYNQKKMGSRREEGRIKLFLPLCRVCFLVLVLWCSHRFFYDFINTNKLTKGSGIHFSQFSPSITYRENGAGVCMVMSIKKMRMKAPTSYNEEEVIEKMNGLLENYESGKESSSTNVIVIMDEAFADLEAVGSGISFSEDPISFFHSLQEDTIRGEMYVSVLAGNTANTEYEFLSGHTMAFMPGGTIPYQLFVRGTYPSLARTMAANGYTDCLAMHPYLASGFNRTHAYEALGFDRFISQDDLDDPDYIRDYISDESDVEKIIELYEEHCRENADGKNEGGFFLFNVTMQNHSAYTSDKIESTITVSNHEGEWPKVEQYATLLKETDQALQTLIEYFQNVDEKTLIVFFGDHEPGIGWDFYDTVVGKSDEISTQMREEEYKVPFIIWANYDIEEKTLEKTSANYLGAIAADLAGVELTGYQKYLLNLSETIPAINALGYWGDDGNFYEIKDKESPYYDLINEYQCIQYNSTFGNRYERFFLPES